MPAYTLLSWGTVEAAWMLTGSSLVLISVPPLDLSFLSFLSVSCVDKYGFLAELWWGFNGKIGVVNTRLCCCTEEACEEGRKTLFIRVWPIQGGLSFPHAATICKQNRCLSMRLLMSTQLVLGGGRGGWTSLSRERDG